MEPNDSHKLDIPYWKELRTGTDLEVVMLAILVFIKIYNPVFPRKCCRRWFTCDTNLGAIGTVYEPATFVYKSGSNVCRRQVLCK
jgi:hypothetical protein